MIYAIVGAGGKTGLLKEMAAQFRQEGKSVFVTTTTHMFIEEDTLLTEDASVIITPEKRLCLCGCSGRPEDQGAACV